jgi:hypothetical protein
MHSVHVLRFFRLRCQVYDTRHGELLHDVVGLRGERFWDHFANKVQEGDIAALSGEQTALLYTMFETLSKIVALPDERTQGYALHGLGHLHHPDVHRLVQQYLHEHQHRLSSEDIRWIEKCRDGTVM